MANPYQTERLVFRAAEQPDDEEIVVRIQQEPLTIRNSDPSLARPQSKEHGRKHLKFLAEEALLGLVLCLPPPAAAAPDAPAPRPIGTLHLEAQERQMAHHRSATLGIDVLAEYQGRGYGSEAIRWALRWAFETAGLHRVEVRALGWNHGAVRLYERLGFRHEGLLRETWWFEGRWWDDYIFGMLESDWRAMNAGAQ